MLKRGKVSLLRSSEKLRVRSFCFSTGLLFALLFWSEWCFREAKGLLGMLRVWDELQLVLLIVGCLRPPRGLELPARILRNLLFSCRGWSLKIIKKLILEFLIDYFVKLMSKAKVIFQKRDIQLVFELWNTLYFHFTKTSSSNCSLLKAKLKLFR